MEFVLTIFIYGSILITPVPSMEVCRAVAYEVIEKYPTATVTCGRTWEI